MNGLNRHEDTISLYATKIKVSGIKNHMALTPPQYILYHNIIHLSLDMQASEQQTSQSPNCCCIAIIHIQRALTCSTA
jgi:hypothetical protein